MQIIILNVMNLNISQKIIPQIIMLSKKIKKKLKKMNFKKNLFFKKL
jgi:hypothetical protein